MNFNYTNIHTNDELKISNKTCNIFDTNLANIIGIEAALFLNKLNYWVSKCGRYLPNHEGAWIYNSLPSWKKQFPYLSMYKLRKTIKTLEDTGLIKSVKINAGKWNHTKWYTIDLKKYNSLITMHSESYYTKNEESINLSNTNNNNYTSNVFKLASKKIKSIAFANTILLAEKTTNRSVDFHHIIITKNNYTNKPSYKKDGVELENTLKEKIEENPINSNEKEIINKMVYIWNKVFEYSISPIKAYSNKKNQEVLLNLYKTVFKGDLNNWREYACKVNSSQFLMGEKKTKNNFKAVFGWLIKEETIEKILNGEYGVGDRELDINNITKNIEEKKEEVVNKMDKKISEYIRLKIDETKERREFEEYIKINQAERKEDEYGILKAIKHISYHSIFRTNEYEVLRESLYESYVMKKYLGLTKMEARKKIRERTKEVVDDKGINEMVIEELNKKGKEIEYFDISDGMGKIGLHSI